MGFAATPDGMLYVFGGWARGDDGNTLGFGVQRAQCVQEAENR